jgi:hypothetical protein
MTAASAGDAEPASVPFEPPHVVTQLPFSQPAPCAQTLPQAPQFCESESTLMQLPVADAPTLPHFIVPEGHAARQAPPAQTSDPGHVETHDPAVHVCPTLQWVLHAPQLLGSVCRYVHELPHAVEIRPPKLQLEQSRPPSWLAAAPQPLTAPLPPHDWTHVPPEQVCPFAHLLLHAPQLLKSVDSSTQVPVWVPLLVPQRLVPPAHEVPQNPVTVQTPPPAQIGVHCPLTQFCPLAHWLLHEPQLFVSVWSSTHWLPHCVNVAPPKLHCEQLMPPS